MLLSSLLRTPQFDALHPERGHLFLTVPNEFGVTKFVCSTLRPTELPYRKIYDLNNCVDFIAHYLHYEPLETPCAPPACLPSPAQVLAWTYGDSFDFAVVLCSFLLGAGYDAFVAYGTAPYWITTRDQTRLSCPHLRETATPQQGALRHENGIGIPAAAGKAESKDEPYVRLSKSADADAPAAKHAEQEGGGNAEEKQWDPLHGRRVHAWVVVRGGKRAMDSIVCIEPTTGRQYPASACPYLSLEAVFNASNFWVNMQTKVRPSEVSYDLRDTALWEYVFIDHADAAGGSNRTLRRLRSSAGPDDVSSGDERDVLDLPPSWVTRLHVPRESFARRYPPDGSRTILYRRSKLELFAEGLHREGVVMRLTLYSDDKRTKLTAVRELFEQRRDRLRHRVRHCSSAQSPGSLYELFLPGRQGALKEVTELPGQQRTLTFYSEARLDGLKCRTENMRSKIVELFEGRADRLLYRSINLLQPAEAEALARGGGSSQGEMEEQMVAKMTEKYAREERIRAERDVAKRTFYVTEGRIRTLFHYARDRCVPVDVSIAVVDKNWASINTIEHKAGALTGVTNGLAGGGGTSSSDAMPLELETLQDIIAAEKECFTAARHLHLEMLDLARTRQAEETSVGLVKPIHELARFRRLPAQMPTAAAVVHQQMDYLTPFLAHVADASAITREEAARARDACLRSLKDRLLERANIINTRLNEENSLLAKRQAAFQRNQRDNDGAAEEEFEHFCAEAMFRIQILEQRLVQHESTALTKYAELDAKLSADPRLAALGGGH
ncbi:hypothetical protein JKP88DRAFT_171511 [Tribonema minus]|uniref:Coiled-coil domain-containing protein 135 n=1 Tax=Tribonema minus TaxID=303371 RepID=A0A835YIG5_9STRA|nr:hypothetical protein JKP88DRAFT_171511 [Tribonema minus]